MSESRHTPGPWKLSNDAQGPCIVMHPTLEGVAIASLTNIHEPVNGFVEIEAAGAPERTANARLIAAAPELLAACETMLALIGPHDTGLASAANLMRAAIAKAKGEPASYCPECRRHFTGALCECSL